MKRSYKIENLDCAHCAGKMETAINKIPGVKHATVSFMLARLTIDAEDENFEQIMSEVEKAVTGVNLTCKVKR
ncbi:MAG: heavy-metal-associated domain-containing protein [Ruminococcaceae bacterium]|nr:heavy-metal-associated domain-containing protein [Oscillospiraceae bacterium]